MATEEKSGSIYLVQLICCLSCAMCVRSMEILPVTLIYPYKDRNDNEAEKEARFYSKVTIILRHYFSKDPKHYLILKTPAK